MTVLIPPEHHVARHIKSTLLIRADDDSVIGCYPQAFQLRSDEKSISTSWLEHYSGDRKSQLPQIAANSDREIRPRDALGISNVGTLVSECAKIGVKPRILHEPTPRNPAHTAIRRLPRNEMRVLALFAHTFSKDLVVAGDLLPRGKKGGVG
jgi:hypothetical protein